jgi:hypothetical protein
LSTNQNLKSFLAGKWDKITKIVLFLFIFSLFFPIRYVFNTKTGYLIGEFSDFTAISLYLSDILLILLAFIVFLPKLRSKTFQRPTSYLLLPIFWLILCLFIVFFTHLALNKALNLWHLIKFLELIVAYGTMAELFKKFRVEQFFKYFAFFGVLESILVILQFLVQHPLGLNRLGEQPVSRFLPGFAKIVVDGVTYLRGYGTFPHPNPLSAFLVINSLIICYFLVKEGSKRLKTLLGLVLFVNILAVTVTFSRAAFLALIFGLVVFFSYLLTKSKEKSIVGTVAIVIFSLLASVAIFKPLLITRATITDKSTAERITYNQHGWQMFKDHPVFGVGLGESVLQSQNYYSHHLEPWEKQPPHNYFILAAAEMGALGALLLIWIFASHLKKVLSIMYKVSGNTNLATYYLLLTTILLCILVLMLFDHYFYTLQQTQMLLWVMLGIIASEIKKSPTRDRMLTPMT